MPFESKAQQGWMFANKPEMAKRWAAETPNIKNLPQHVGDRTAQRGAILTRLRVK
jgi:hypothetical protein